MFYINICCWILERIIYILQHMDSYLLQSCCRHEHLCFMRHISWTNLQILHFSPIMRHQGCFPRVSPLINTGWCKGVCALWQGKHLYQPLLNIHSFALNKQINQHYRHNTFLLPSICSVLPLPTSGAGLWVAQGQEGGAVPCSQPVPCSMSHISGALPWGIPMRAERGWSHTAYSPPSLCHHPVQVDPAAAGHRASLGVGPLQCHQELPLEHQCLSHVGITNHLDTFASLRVPHMTSSACVCTRAGAKPWQPQGAAGQHVFVLCSLCSESLWQPCPNNPIGQKCKQLHAQEVFLKMPFISRRGEIWNLGCGELTGWPFILRGHWCLKTAPFLNEITLGGLGLLRKKFFAVLKIRAWEYTDINTKSNLSAKWEREPWAKTKVH